MIKAFSKHLLSLLVFLSGYNLVHANNNHNSLHSSVKILQESVYQNLEASQNTPLTSSTYLHSKHEKENQDLIDFIVYDDDQEDELISFKKCLERANYSTAILFSQPSGYFSSNQLPSFQGNFSYTSSRRYLTFQVFRI